MSTAISSPSAVQQTSQSLSMATGARLGAPTEEAPVSALRSRRSDAPADASSASERLRTQIRSVGPHFRTALITGERGARKEEVARALHFASPVAKGPFVVCDSGLLESLLRSESAGASKNAQDRALCRNLTRTAHGGTIFFPELNLFSRAAQRELVHFLDCLKGEHTSRIRVIASLSGEVQAMVAGGTLLADLRERIGILELAVAPLRERLADFEGMAKRILAEISARAGEQSTPISEAALQELQRRGWPGNDRELESTLRMAALTSGGQVIEPKHLPASADQTPAAEQAPRQMQTSSMKLQDVMDAHVQNILQQCDGNKLKAAEVLGISRSTLYRMLDALSVAV